MPAVAKVKSPEIPPLVKLLCEDRRYKLEAYQFVRAGLGYAQEVLGMGGPPASEDPADDEDTGGNRPRPRHVTGQELCRAFQQLAHEQYGYMARLVSPNGTPALSTAAGAHNYRIRGLELTSAPGVYTLNTISVGTGSETSQDQLPSSIELDRLYVHGDRATGGKRGISLNGRHVVVSNSHFADYKSTWQDTQAIMGWNGTGPYQILNNYLEASGENIMFGGATPKISGLVPSDIVIRNNHFFKPLSWKIGDPSYVGTAWLVKNLIELKNGRRVTIDLGAVPALEEYRRYWPYLRAARVRTTPGQLQLDFDLAVT